MKGCALQWLSQREHSRAELRRKLLRQARSVAAEGEGPTDSAVRVDEVLDWLEAHRYLSNERFVESRIHARSSRYGNLRIRQELGQHQVAMSAEAAQTLRDSEMARAAAVRERKFDGWPVDASQRARQARFLAGRGFSPEVITRLLRLGPDS